MFLFWVILDFLSFFKCSVQMLLYQLPKSQVYYSCCIMCALHVVIGVRILFLKIKCSYSVLPKHSVQLMLQLVVISSFVIFRCSFPVLVKQQVDKLCCKEKQVYKSCSLPKNSVQLMLQLVVILNFVIFRCSYSFLVKKQVDKLCCKEKQVYESGSKKNEWTLHVLKSVLSYVF